MRRNTIYLILSAILLLGMSPSHPVLAAAMPLVNYRTPKAPAVLPRSLYYLGSVDARTGLGQVYRLARDGSTKTRITSESAGISEFDVSPVSGALVYRTGSRLVLADANGGSRRVLAANFTAADAPVGPRWSPDGRMIAYARHGVYLYSLATGSSRLVLADNTTTSYLPLDFSPDGFKLTLLSKGLDEVGVFDIGSRTFSPLRLAAQSKYRVCCSPSSWSGDSKHIFVSDWLGAGRRAPGLWRYNTSGLGVSLFPGTGESLNKAAAPRLDATGHLVYLFSPPETGLDDPSIPFSLVRSDADGVSNRVALRPELFHVTDTTLWAPDGRSLVLLQNNGKASGFGSLILIPVDPARHVVILLADASTLGRNPLRWGR